MSNEYEIMEALQGFIVSHIGEYYPSFEGNAPTLSSFTTGNVPIDDPDPDNMPKKDTMWLVFDNGTSEEDSSMTDVAAMAINIHIMCSKDTQTNLQKKAWGYYSALYRLLRNNQTIGGACDFVTLTDWVWYPQVTAKPGTVCIMATATIQYHKSWG